MHPKRHVFAYVLLVEKTREVRSQPLVIMTRHCNVVEEFTLLVRPLPNGEHFCGAELSLVSRVRTAIYLTFHSPLRVVTCESSFILTNQAQRFVN